MRTAPVVACTCLGARDARLNSARFDVCIVDEASQVITMPLPVVLGYFGWCEVITFWVVACKV